MRTGLTTHLAVALCATGLLIAGCGDDDEGTTVSSTTTTTAAATGTTGTEGEQLSEDQYVARANEICDQGDADLDEAAAEAFSSGQPSEAEASAFFADSVIPGIQSQIDEIRSLSGPAEVESEVTGVLDDAQEILDELSGDPSSFEDADNPFADVNERFTALGITSCADDS